MWSIARAVLLDKRIVSVGCLLLAVVSVDSQLPCGLHPIRSELDTFEHFLFGFVLSDLASKIASSMALDELLSRKFGQWKPRRVDLLIRMLGFFFIGGVLWELSEYFFFPLLSRSPDSFFAFPITLKNIDGTIDVTVGAIGCFLAWCLAQQRVTRARLPRHSLPSSKCSSSHTLIQYHLNSRNDSRA